MAWFWILPLSAHEMARPEPNPEVLSKFVRCHGKRKENHLHLRFTLHDAASPLPVIPLLRQLVTSQHRVNLLRSPWPMSNSGLVIASKPACWMNHPPAWQITVPDKTRLLIRHAFLSVAHLGNTMQFHAKPAVLAVTLALSAIPGMAMAADSSTDLVQLPEVVVHGTRSYSQADGSTLRPPQLAGKPPAAATAPSCCKTSPA
jgi:hypothetical protein